MLVTLSGVARLWKTCSSLKTYVSVSEMWELWLISTLSVVLVQHPAVKCCSPVRKRVKSQPQATFATLWVMPEQSWRVKTSALWPSPSWPLWFCPHTNTAPSSVQHRQSIRHNTEALNRGHWWLSLHLTCKIFLLGHFSQPASQGSWNKQPEIINVYKQTDFFDGSCCACN